MLTNTELFNRYVEEYKAKFCSLLLLRLIFIRSHSRVCVRMSLYVPWLTLCRHGPPKKTKSKRASAEAGAASAEETETEKFERRALRAAQNDALQQRIRKKCMHISLSLYLSAWLYIRSLSRCLSLYSLLFVFLNEAASHACLSRERCEGSLRRGLSASKGMRAVPVPACCLYLTSTSDARDRVLIRNR
jgi:hypothetical protein